MHYTPNEIYDLQVDAQQSLGENFILRVFTADGESYVSLPKLAFQKHTSELPATIPCRIKGIREDGLPIVAHDIRGYVFNLYEAVFRNHGTIECEVTMVPENPAEEPYSVRDRNGIYYNLFEPEAILTRGQRVRCKFMRLTPRFFSMALVDDGAKMPFFTPEELMADAGVQRETARFIIGHILTLPEFSAVREEINARVSRWPLTAATVVRRHLNEWFSHARLSRNNGITTALIDAVRNTLLYLLEGSAYLNAVTSEQRRSTQQQLTEIVESLEPYSEALELIRAGMQDVFVASVFDKLEKSGYLYHPSMQFGVLMLIFREQPDRVRSYLNRIFESIFGRDLANWKREPFRSAFVEQFEMYIRQSRKEIDALPIADTREQKNSLETIIIAIALQLLLSDDPRRFSRNRSLLYRYISLLRPLQSEALLSKSFLTLMGAQLPEHLTYEGLRQPMMMMTQATVMPDGDILSRLEGIHFYSTPAVEFTVSKDGLVLERKNALRERVIPDGLMNWLSPQIYTPGIRSMSATKLRRLADRQLWWNEIEQSLFETAGNSVESQELERAKVDEEVWIVIDSVSNAYDNDPIFNCRIRMDGKEEGSGILRRSEIVTYNLKMPSELSYRTAGGEQLGFYARVIEVNSDGNYVFSLKDEVNSYIHNELNYEDEYVAVVTGSNPMGYSAICNNGIGLYLINDGSVDCQAGDLVRFKLRSGNMMGNIFGYITETNLDPALQFSKASAFEHLMNAIGIAPGEEDGAEENEDNFRDTDEIITPDDMREIIEILRFSALAQRDLITAYDYLRYARMLALLIEDMKLSTALGTHAALLSQHQYYATNNRIEPEILDSLRADSRSNPLLSMIFHRLEIVSWLGRDDHNAELYATTLNPESDLEGALARMVLSFNMLSDDDASENAVCAGLRENIKNKLNINSEKKNGKYYGSESKYLEFKTSIVFPATGAGTDPQPNPEQQQFHILSRIAGLLNAAGGRLYIGVNNDGYAVGLHDDFKYFERHRAQLGSRLMSINNVDNLCVFIENLIHETFGAKVSRKIEVCADQETDKAVIQIKVEQSLEPVLVDGRLFVRQSGQATREYHGEDIQEFIKERAAQRAEQSAAMQAALAVEEPLPEKPSEATAPEVPQAVEEEKGPVQRIQLRMSRWKPNILHEYDAEYVEPFGYIYFTGENTLTYSKQDLYLEQDPDSRGVLIIPHELKDGFLVLAFKGEKVVKIPLAEIYERGDNIAATHNADNELQFVAVASKDDGLLSVVADNSGTLWKRAFSLAQIENGHLNTVPKRLLDASVNHTVAWEIIDSGAMENFSDCLSEKGGTRKIGSSLRVRESEPRAEEKISELSYTCAPSR